MKKMKLIAMGLITAMCLSSMVACGDSSDSSTTSTSNSSSETSSNNSSNNSSNSKSDEKVIYSQDVKVINNTGVEIAEMYISASQKNDWEEDVLWQDTFASGTELNIKFEEEEEAQYWDLMVKDSEGNSITWTNIDLFTISEITLNFDPATGEATASYK